MDLQDGLACPVEESFRCARLAVVETLGRGQRGKERQGENAPGPGHLNQQHGREPAQAAGLDEESFRGANRVAIDAAGADLLAPAPLDGVVEANDDRGTSRHEDADEHSQQQPGCGPRRPPCPVENSMVGREIGPLIKPEDAQCRRDDTSAR